MKHSKTNQKKIEVLRNFVESSIKKVNRIKSKGYISLKGGRPDPRFSYKIDAKTNKILLCYTIPIKDSTKKKGYKRVQKSKWLPDITLDNYKTKLDVLHDYQYVVKQNEEAISDLYVDEGTLEYWMEWFCDYDRRKTEVVLERDAVKHRTLDGYRYYLFDYCDWLKEHQPKFTSLSSHNNKQGVEVYLEYLRYRADKGGVRKKWGATTLHTSYKSLRVLINWLGRKEENRWFDTHRWSKLEQIPQPENNRTSFTPVEFRKVLEFMDEYKEHPNWFWFIKVLRVMLVSGCRIGEVRVMRINELQSQTITQSDTKETYKVWRWNFTGKGDRTRTIFIDSSHCYQDILGLITDKEGNIRTDKEFVFHRHFFKSSNPNQESMGSGFIERTDLPYSQSGVQHKFKKMVKFLGLNGSLSPHSCRRFFIQEKLRETNGDLNLVRLLVGHSSLKMVMYYHQTDQEYNSLIGVRNTLDFSKVNIRNERVSK
jgi:integrase